MDTFFHGKEMDALSEAISNAIEALRVLGLPPKVLGHVLGACTLSVLQGMLVFNFSITYHEALLATNPAYRELSAFLDGLRTLSHLIAHRENALRHLTHFTQASIQHDDGTRAPPLPPNTIRFSDYLRKKKQP